MSRIAVALLRPVRNLSYAIETLISKMFRGASRLPRSGSAGRFVEDGFGRVAGALTATARGPSKLGSRFERGVVGLLGFVRRWRLNYLIAGLFGGAILYQIYLLSVAEGGGSRTALLTSLRFTIYFAIIYFSLARFITSEIRPWTAVWRGWSGVFGRIRALPLMFGGVFLIYLTARLIGYVPVSYFAGREAYVLAGNFVLGALFFIAFALFSRKLYWLTIADRLPVARNATLRRLIIAAAVIWVLNALVNALLTPLVSLATPRWAAVVFQFVWLAHMLWTAATLFILPALIAGVVKPVRSGVRGAWAVLWTLVVSLILVNLPADVFTVLSSGFAARLPGGLPTRLGVDVVSALVNAVVFFASQAAILMLFVATFRRFDTGAPAQE